LDVDCFGQVAKWIALPEEGFLQKSMKFFADVAD